jgi:hypothetical protein
MPGEGMTIDEFIRRNADRILLHQEKLSDYLEAQG